MKTITQYIKEQKYNDLISEEFCEIVSENMINESFKSSLIQKLAAKISKAEASENKSKIKNAERLDKEYPRYDGSKHDPNLVNFASIFGPITITPKYNSKNKRKVRGLKWSEITDDQFVLYKGIEEGINKDLSKIIKNVCAHKLNANFIICKKDTDDVVMFIRGYNESKETPVRIFYFTFDRPSPYGGITRGGVHAMERQKSKWKTRELKADEIIEEIQGYDVYMLEITDSMIEDYTVLATGRKESQEGIINYDKKSLEDLLKNQQARYKSLVKKIKADKLIGKSDELFNEINKVNQEVQNLYNTIINTFEYKQDYYRLGRLMEYVSHAYEYFFKYLDNKKAADKTRAEYAEKYNRTYTDSYYDTTAEEYINDCKEKLDKVKEEIDNIKQSLK